MATAAPASARRTAKWRPMPDAAPDTMIFRSSSFMRAPLPREPPEARRHDEQRQRNHHLDRQPHRSFQDPPGQDEGNRRHEDDRQARMVRPPAERRPQRPPPSSGRSVAPSEPPRCTRRPPRSADRTRVDASARPHRTPPLPPGQVLGRRRPARCRPRHGAHFGRNHPVGSCVASLAATRSLLGVRR